METRASPHGMRQFEASGTGWSLAPRAYSRWVGILETRLSSQPFRFRKWLIVSRGTLLRLDLHHLVQPAGNKNSRVLLQAGIFAVAFLGIESKTDNIPIRASDQLGRRFGRGGVADLGRIPKIDGQHGEDVRLVVFRTRISDVATAICAGARAQRERKSEEQEGRTKTARGSARGGFPSEGDGAPPITTCRRPDEQGDA